jgi:ADP-ribosylglycohydrolase
MHMARDRARGALVGLACGDAVGTTLEFKRPGSFRPIDDMIGGGPFGLESGQWTDDTSTALCLAESLVDRAGHDPVDQLRRYLRWWRSGYLSSNGRCFDIGNTTSAQLGRFERTGEPVDPSIDEDAAANGSLMRLAPVPVLWHAELEVAIEQSAASSRTTHAAPRPVDACRVLGAMVAALIRGEAVDAVLDPSFWRFGPLHPAVNAVARGSWRTKSPPEIRGSGYCVDALEAAIWAVAGADDFASAVLRAANLGDDADTTAAIAGQLAGARFGESSIRGSWLGKLALRSRIQSLADALFAAAVDEPHPWAFDPELHAWWVEPGSLLAGEYPGHADPARARAKLELLADAGIRTIVDLTTDADGLVPYSSTLAAIATARDLDVRRVHHPIPDFDVLDTDGYRAILATIKREVTGGRPVFVHCWGGIGRTGTVIGCHLVAGGLEPDDAHRRLADLRSGTHKADRPCPESARQVAAIHRFGR